VPGGAGDALGVRVRGAPDPAGTDRPATPHTLLAAARILAAKGKDRDAEFVLGRIVREYPAFVPAYVELSELYLRKRRVDQAVSILCQGTKTMPNDPVLRNNLGMCWLLKNSYQRAFSEFQAAAGCDPDDARYRANMALALGMMGRYDEALALYRQVVTEMEAHENLAIIGEARRDPSFAARQWALVQSLGVEDE
jgi:Flp pilus assembly protein TadD